MTLPFMDLPQFYWPLRPYLSKLHGVPMFVCVCARVTREIIFNANSNTDI